MCNMYTILQYTIFQNMHIFSFCLDYTIYHRLFSIIGEATDIAVGNVNEWFHLHPFWYYANCKMNWIEVTSLVETFSETTVKTLIKWHLSRQYICRSLRSSWSIAWRQCINYNFILDETPAFNGLGKANCNTRWDTLKLWDLVRLILKIWRYLYVWTNIVFL